MPAGGGGRRRLGSRRVSWGACRVGGALPRPTHALLRGALPAPPRAPRLPSAARARPCAGCARLPAPSRAPSLSSPPPPLPAQCPAPLPRARCPPLALRPLPFGRWGGGRFGARVAAPLFRPRPPPRALGGSSLGRGKENLTGFGFRD